MGVRKDKTARNGPSGGEHLTLRLFRIQYCTHSRKPPELLSRILLHLEDFAKDAWPGVSDEAEPEWQRKWHSGMDVDGLWVYNLSFMLSGSCAFVATY